jgi:hypothetical protein
MYGTSPKMYVQMRYPEREGNFGGCFVGFFPTRLARLVLDSLCSLFIPSKLLKMIYLLPFNLRLGMVWLTHRDAKPYVLGGQVLQIGMGIKLTFWVTLQRRSNPLIYWLFLKALANRPSRGGCLNLTFRVLDGAGGL